VRLLERRRLSIDTLMTGKLGNLSLLGTGCAHSPIAMELTLPNTRATSQWFANIDAIKAGALEALKDVKFYPEVCESLSFIQPSQTLKLSDCSSLYKARSRLEAFVRERSEWCISRQRTWGVPIPSLHFIPASSSLSTASPDAETVLLSTESLEHIIKVLEEKGVNHWWDGSAEDFIPPSTLQSLEYGTTKGHWRKGTDTIDVWFDSGSSWGLFSPSERSDAQEFVCLEGSDQHRGWFQSLLLTAISSAESEVGTAEKVKAKAPYTTLITHGFVLDENGKKMSKSLGNVISPIDIIKGGKVRLCRIVTFSRCSHCPTTQGQEERSSARG
jgi:isoleucyl-tRNA synthetase